MLGRTLSPLDRRAVASNLVDRPDGCVRCYSRFTSVFQLRVFLSILIGLLTRSASHSGPFPVQASSEPEKGVRQLFQSNIASDQALSLASVPVYSQFPYTRYRRLHLAIAI